MQTNLDRKLLKKVEKTIKKLGLSSGGQLAKFTIYDRVNDPNTKRQNSGFDPKTGAYCEKVEKFEWDTTPVFYFDQKEVDGSNVLMDDGMIGITGKDIPFTLQIGDEIEVNDHTWRVVDPRPIYSGLRIAAYVPHIRPV